MLLTSRYRDIANCTLILPISNGWCIMNRVAIAALLLIFYTTPTIANSVFEKSYNTIIDSIKKTCDGKEKCLETASAFAWFLWNNRENVIFIKS